jgi:hypothetical protein
MYLILKETLLNETGAVIGNNFFVVSSSGDKLSQAFSFFEEALVELKILTENDLKNTIKRRKP